MKRSEIVAGAMVIGLLLCVMHPPPSWLMDGLLLINLGAATVAILVAIYHPDPLRFTLFPVFLLLLTALRLGLNLAATRLILQHRGHGDHLGQAIPAFGLLVAGNNHNLGLLWLVGLWLVHAVLIKMRTESVAQMAACYILDYRPDQQMSLDADLISGQVDSATARARRRHIERNLDYFVSMEAMSKLMAGEARLFPLLLLIQLVGAAALAGQPELQPILIPTLGNGLLATLSAFILSTAVLLCTRRTALQNDLTRFMGRAGGWLRQLLLVGAGALFIFEVVRIGCSGRSLPPAPFFVLSGLLHLSLKAQQRDFAMTLRQPEAEPVTAEQLTPIALTDPLSIEVSRALLHLVDPNQGALLAARIPALRDHLFAELGLCLPGVRIRDDLRLPPEEYRICLHGREVARGKVQPHQLLLLAPEQQLDGFQGQRVNEPTYGLPAMWVDPAYALQIGARECQLFAPEMVIATHLCETVRLHASELLCRQGVQSLLDRLPSICAERRQEVLQGMGLAMLQAVLQALLSEQVSIRELPTILEHLCNVRCPSELGPKVEFVRTYLGSNICRQYTEDGKLRGSVLDQVVENALLRITAVPVEPHLSQQLAQTLTQSLKHRQTRPLVLTIPQLRQPLRSLMRAAFPQLAVLSYQEIPPDIQVERLSMR